MNSNSGLFLLDAVINNLGIAKLPDFICQPAIDAGQVVTILEDYTTDPLNIYLIHSEDRRLNKRMRLFTEEMEIACSQAMGPSPL